MKRAAAAAKAGAPPPAPVYAPGYILSASKSPVELAKRLATAFAALKSLEQAEHDRLPAGLENVASALLDPAVLRSKSADLRLLGACCLVEVLRLYAPTPPYAAQQLEAALEAVIAALGALATRDGEEESFERACHVLESLATVRSCVIVVELAMEGAGSPGGDALLVSLFDTLLGAAL
jgi:sister-chromatid-cohesion protein PDS5